MSAFITNRVGDAFLTIGMFILLWSLGNRKNCKIFKDKKQKISSLTQYYLNNTNICLGPWLSNINPISSTTIRKYSNSSFAPYLAGLIEGDGHIAVHDKNTQKKEYRPKIIIAFNINDKPLAEKLSTGLKVGKIIDRSSAGHVLLQILAKQEVLKIINLVNGHMRTPKIEALHRAIRWINEKDNSSIPLLGIDSSCLDSNSWLAGFTDASSPKGSGCFGISLNDSNRTARFYTKFEYKLTLPNNGENVHFSIGSEYFRIFILISEFFKTSVSTKLTLSKNIKFVFTIIGHSSYNLKIITEYYDKFLLLGSKAVYFMDWKNSRLLDVNKDYKKLKEIKTKKTNRDFAAQATRIKNLLNQNLKFYTSMQTYDSTGLRQIEKKSFSTTARVLNKKRLYTEESWENILEYVQKHPGWITGFVDGEGNFRLDISKNKSYQTGYSVKAVFQICLHLRDEAILKAINAYFGVGNIFLKGEDAIEFKVQSFKDLEKIIAHFEQHPLMTTKSANYLLFKKALGIIQRKEHLLTEGLEELVAIKASMNLGLPDSLKSNFPNIKPVELTSTVNIKITDPEWIAGFTTAEGCFYLEVRKRSDRKGYQIQLIYKLTQHIRDEILMKSLISYFDCGNVYLEIYSANYRVQKFSDIVNKINPFFSKHKILGVKHQDYLDWCEALEIIKVKSHLTEEGLSNLLIIKNKMKRFNN